ncbi:helix-turn-helix domain-containing protein [Paenibacillus puerhi]|uniref:helix-turn-helix domain-containing protein n=1 Tax=Paenibacillus puerhi TaxID=2692622 RepID=UPI001358FB70|nr:helix-turn-helix domain-containing protein [Paenibacillus puerhi]
MWRSKYLRRLTVFCLILVTIPVISLGILSYMKARGIIEEKVIQGQVQVLNQTRLKVEQLLQTIDNSMIQFTISPIVSQSIRANLAARDFQKINDLTEGLHKLQTYDVGMKNVRLSSLEGRWSLDNNAFAPLSEEGLKMLTQIASTHETSMWVTDVESRDVRLVKKLPINAVNNPAGILEVTVPDSRLQKLVPDMTVESMTLILDGQYRLLTHDTSNPTFSQDTIEGVIGHLKTLDAKEGYTTVQLNHVTVGIAYSHSDYNGWNYISLVSIELITKDSRAIGFYTILICSVIFVLLLVILLFGSHSMYKPIRQVIEIGLGRPMDEMKNLQAEDEFQVIGEHIRTLKLSQTKLLEQIQGQTRKLKEFFIRKLLLGELGTREIQERVSQYYDGMDIDSYFVLTVQIDTLAETRFKESDRDLLMFAVNNIVSDLISPNRRLDPVVLGGNQVTLLKMTADTPEEAKNEVYLAAETIQATVRSLLELKVSVGISRLSSSLAAAEQAYRESLGALKYRIRFGEETILHMEDVLPNSRVQMIFPEWIEKQMIDALMVPDLEKAGQLLHEFLNMTLKENMHHQEYQMILFRLLADLLRELQNVDEALPALADGDRELFQQLLDLKTAAEIEQWFMKTVLKPMVTLMSRKWEARNRNISEQMKDIIHHEFESDLTLDVCAGKLNYHPNYLKTVFRKETGTNFSDYVSQYRLTQAKKWLIETDMKISEIAERLRYQNSQNFIRYFRKLEDMTPGEYRKKYRSS